MSAGEPGQPGERGEGTRGGAGGAGGQGGHGMGAGAGGPGGEGGPGGAVLRSLGDRRLVAAVLVGLALIISYQVYVQKLAHKNAQTATQVKHLTPKVARLSKVQCANQQLLYDLFNALIADSSPHLGSPPGRVVPGARARLIERLYAAERAQAPALRKQGCVVKAPPAGAGVG